MHKDNVTVALDKNIYMSKMEEILSDVDTYQRIQKDPIKKLTQDLCVTYEMEIQGVY